MSAVQPGECVVISRDYLVWRAASLLKLARSLNDPAVAGSLVEKAADLKSRLDDQLDDTTLEDRSPRPPDVEFPLQPSRRQLIQRH